jgi:hypothetical protein
MVPIFKLGMSGIECKARQRVDSMHGAGFVAPGGCGNRQVLYSVLRATRPYRQGQRDYNPVMFHNH